jgi:hypothetical protein
MTALAFLLVLMEVGSARAGDVVWRQHCEFPGKGIMPTEAVYDTGRECDDMLARITVSAEQKCRAGDQKACVHLKHDKTCICRPEKVE